MTALHAYISLFLSLTLFAMGVLGVQTVYQLARRTSNQTARRVSLTMAAVWGGLVVTETGMTIDWAADLGLISSPLEQRIAESPLPDLVLAVVNIASLLLIRQFRGGALEQLAEVFREVYQLRRDIVLDTLTGLGNRLGLSQVTNSAKWVYWSTIMIDVDDFKHYNDTYGHQAGDSILALVGRCIKQNVRNTDLAFRYGGEEFLILCPDTELEEGCRIAERIRQALAATPSAPTLSVGVAFAEAKNSIEESITEADAALYLAKQEGKNRVVPAGRPDRGIAAAPAG